MQIKILFLYLRNNPNVEMKNFWKFLFLALILNITVLPSVKSVLDSDFQKIQVAETLNSENENHMDFINLDEETHISFSIDTLQTHILEEISSMIVSNKIFFISNSLKIHLPPPKNC